MKHWDEMPSHQTLSLNEQQSKLEQDGEQVSSRFGPVQGDRYKLIKRVILCTTYIVVIVDIGCPAQQVGPRSTTPPVKGASETRLPIDP